MKRAFILPIILGIVALTTLFSCGVDRWPEYQTEIGRDLWIDSVMRQEYLWHEDIPASNELNYFLQPEEFFKKLLSSKDKDFSGIDTLDSAPVLSYGFNCTLYKLVDNDTAYNALVTYVLPESPAANAGLQRGDWLTMMNNDYITKRNEKDLIDGADKLFTVGKYIVQKDENDEDVGVIQTDREVAVTAARVNTDTPIHTTYLYEIDQKRVGYLVYSSFTAGTATHPQEYNDKLRELFAQYKASGVNEFILDLRYNSGGEMECAQLLSTLLAPADRMNSPWAILKFNNKQVGKNRELAFNPELIQTGANLNLSTIYVLTTGETAAASEMVINCLKPSMNVVLIGATTKGENVATEAFVNRQYNWSIRPVVCLVYNSKEESNYANGFVPQYSVNEFADLRYFLPLGNPEEALLNTALRLIAGEIPTTQAGAQSNAQQMKALKNVKPCPKISHGLNIK